jgi:predicted ferric reductase
VLFLAFLLSILAGVLFAKDLVKRSTMAASVGVTSLLTSILLLVIAMGEYFGYPAWYHEVGLFVCFVILFVLLGLLVGGVVTEKWLDPSRWAMVGLVGGYALLLGVGVAAYLSRVEYLQDRADRWDAGYFTTIVHPTDGTLILPDGDSGIEWVARCAKTFADLRGLEFKNY